MTEKKLEELLRTWQQRLRLDRWDLCLRFDLEVADDNEAEIRVHDWYDQASIRISPRFVEWSFEQAQSVLVHELVHVFEKGVRRAADSACTALPGAASELYWSWYVYAAEQMVEYLSQALLSAAGEPIPFAPPAQK